MPNLLILGIMVYLRLFWELLVKGLPVPAPMAAFKLMRIGLSWEGLLTVMKPLDWTGGLLVYFFI